MALHTGHMLTPDGGNMAERTQTMLSARYEMFVYISVSAVRRLTLFSYIVHAVRTDPHLSTTGLRRGPSQCPANLPKRLKADDETSPCVPDTNDRGGKLSSNLLSISSHLNFQMYRPTV